MLRKLLQAVAWIEFVADAITLKGGLSEPINQSQDPRSMSTNVRPSVARNPLCREKRLVLWA
jgi:hypothetical protein